jgi:hypothetical protein
MFICICMAPCQSEMGSRALREKPGPGSSHFSDSVTLSSMRPTSREMPNSQRLFFKTIYFYWHILISTGASLWYLHACVWCVLIKFPPLLPGSWVWLTSEHTVGSVFNLQCLRPSAWTLRLLLGKGIASLSRRWVCVSGDNGASVPCSSSGGRHLNSVYGSSLGGWKSHPQQDAIFVPKIYSGRTGVMPTALWCPPATLLSPLSEDKRSGEGPGFLPYLSSQECAKKDSEENSRTQHVGQKPKFLLCPWLPSQHLGPTQPSSHPNLYAESEGAGPERDTASFSWKLIFSVASSFSS